MDTDDGLGMLSEGLMLRGGGGGCGVQVVADTIAWLVWGGWV